MLFHVDIDPRADLIGGFFLVHGLETVIGCGVKSEGWLTVYQGVTLGGNGGRRIVNEVEISQPYIEDGMTIYTGAFVLEPVHIGEGTVIKAGSIISHDIEV